MKVLVTGGAGFIGSHVAKALLNEGHDVVIMDNLNSYYSPAQKRRNIPKEAKFVEGDIRNKSDICQAVEGGVDVVCHMAAMAGVGYSLDNPMTYYENNIIGSLNLFLESGCHNIVYASSSSVYGDSTTRFSEEDACNVQISPYASSKKGLEVMATSLSHVYGWKMIGLRFFTVYGPRGRPDMAPYKFVSKVAKGETINQHGDGTTLRDYTFISDIVSGVVASIKQVSSLPPRTHTIYNLGNGKPVKLVDFIATVEKVVGKKAIINVVDEKLGDVKVTNADVSKASRELGYCPVVDIESGITMLWNWYREAITE